MKIICNDFKPNEIIKMIRENAGKTQAEFGKQLNGLRNYDFELLLQIAKKENLIITIESKK